MSLGAERVLNRIWEKDSVFSPEEKLTKTEVAALYQLPYLDINSEPVTYSSQYDEEGKPLTISRIRLTTHADLASGSNFTNSFPFTPSIKDTYDGTTRFITQEAFIFMLRQELATSFLSAQEIINNTKIINRLIRQIRKMDDSEQFNQELNLVFNDEELSLSFRLLVAEWFSHYPASNIFYCQNCDARDLLFLSSPLLTPVNWVEAIFQNPNLNSKVLISLCCRTKYLEPALASPHIKPPILLQTLVHLRDVHRDFQDTSQIPIFSNLYSNTILGLGSQEPTHTGWTEHDWDEAIDKVIQRLRYEEPNILDLPNDWIEELYKL